MEVICENCGSKLNVPDEKIPRDQRVKITCPKCKNKVTLGSGGAREEHAAPPEKETEPASPKPEEEQVRAEEEETFDFFEEGTKLAMVLDNDSERLQKVSKAIEELDYRNVSIRNTREAISKMRLHRFDLVMVFDNFDGIELENSPILHFLNHLSMSIRRLVFVVLVSNSLKTMDLMTAFSMSANLIINVDDLDRLSSILHKAILDNERFYKVFMDTLVETGKA